MADVTAITVESSNNGTYAEGAITITKPTGLAVGDLLLAILGITAGNTISTPAGWTRLIGDNTALWSISNLEPAVVYKVADSGDVAASNFSFDVTDGTGSLGGSLFRISGFNTTTPITVGVAGNDSTSGTSRSHTISFTPAQTNSILFCVMGAEATGTSVTSVSSTGSPTWTEVSDQTAGGGVLWVGYAPYSSVTEVTNFSATLAASTSRSATYLFAVRTAINSLGTNTLLSVSPTQFTQAGSAGASGSAGLLEVSPTTFDQSGLATTPTQWVNEAKPSTIWTNDTL